MPPPLDCANFDFSLGEEVAFGPCAPQLESSVVAQVPPQRLPSPEPCWRGLADQHQKALGDALEANSQVGTPKPSPRPLVLGFSPLHPAEAAAWPRWAASSGPWAVGLS